MLDLIHTIESARIVHAQRATGFRMGDLAFQDPCSLRGADDFEAGEVAVKGQQAARLQVIAASSQAAQLGLLSEIVAKGVKGNHDQRELSVELKMAHVGLGEPRRRPVGGKFHTQFVEHRGRVIQPFDIDACAQAGDQNAARPAGHVQHRALRFLGQTRIELDAVVAFVQEHVVKFGVVKCRRKGRIIMVVHGRLVLRGGLIAEGSAGPLEYPVARQPLEKMESKMVRALMPNFVFVLVCGSLLSAGGLRAEQFLLEIPGDPATRSTADVGLRGMTIIDARGDRFDYAARPELDSEDGRYVAYYSAETRRYIRFPVDGRGAMVLGTAIGGGISWKRSLMQVRPLRERPDPLDGADPRNAGLVRRRSAARAALQPEVAAVTAPDGTIWTAQIDDDGTLDLYERRENEWRHKDVELREPLPPFTPLAMSYDERTDSPRFFAVGPSGDVVEVRRSRLRSLTDRREVMFPRMAHLAADSDRGRTVLVLADVQGRIWEVDADAESAELIERRSGIFEPGLPIGFAVEGNQAELFACDRGGRLLGYSMEPGGWSSPYLVAAGLPPSASVAAFRTPAGRLDSQLYLAATDVRGTLHVWRDVEGVLIDQRLGDVRCQPGGPVALFDVDGQIAVSAVAVDGRWMEWRRDPVVADHWEPRAISDGFSSGSRVVMLPSAGVGFAVDRTGRVVVGQRRGERWDCHFCSPGSALAPRIARRSIVPNEPLPPVTVHFENRHSEELLLRIHDLETGAAPVEVKLAPGESAAQRIQRSSGATLEESYFATLPSGQVIDDRHRVPLPPKARYTVTVYVNRETSVYFDRTRNKGPIPDEVNKSLVSVGVFVIPPGGLVEDDAHIDVYREALGRRNPGAVSLLEQPEP